MTNSNDARSPIYIELESILEEHMRIHRILVDLAKKETQYILSRDDANLPMLLKEQERSLSEVVSLEEKRISIVQQIAIEAGIAEDSTLRELLGFMPADEATRFRTSLTQLSRMVEELSIVNQTNARLLSQASAYSRMLLEATTGSEHPAIAYGPSGTKRAKLSRRSIVDRQA